MFVFMFIVTGNIFGAVFFQDEFGEQIEYNVGGFNQISEAQIRAKFYVPRMEKEMNYSSNIAALNHDSSPQEWRETPSKEQLISGYIGLVGEEFKSQNQLESCSPPKIGEVSAESGTTYTAEFSDPFVTCSDFEAESSDKISSANIKIPKENLEVQNYNNTYINLLRTAVDLSNHVRSNLPDFESWPEGTATTKQACDPEDRDGEARSDAISQAKDDASEDRTPAEDAVQDFETSEELEIESSSDFSYTGSVATDSQDCTYTKDDCDPESEDCEENDERIEYTADYEVSSIRYDYTLETKDKEKVLDSNANLQPLDYSFWFVQD